MPTPMWWVREFMNQPQRTRGKEWERQVVKCDVDDIIDLAGFMGKTWPWTTTHAVKYPAEFWEESSPDQFLDEYDCGNDVLAAISDLYEDAEWSIARIADWVATIEPQDGPTTQRTHEVPHEVLDEPAHSHHDR